MPFSTVRARASVFFFLSLLCAPWLAAQTPPAATGASHAITLRIIVVSSQEKAQRVLQFLQQGRDFAELAKEESIDPTADDGGLMARVDPATLRPELRDAVAGLDLGTVSPIVHIPLGYAILKVVSGADKPVSEINAADAATGSVKYTQNISGVAEFEMSFSKAPKPANFDQDLQLICQTRKQSLANAKKSFEDYLSPANESVRAAGPPMDVLDAYFGSAELDAYSGDMEQAVQQYLNAYQLAELKVPPAALPLTAALGIAYLHKSEMENGVYRDPGDRCLRPMLPENAFSKREDSEQAISYFSKYLIQKPDDLEIRWLLNFAYMTMGEYPQKVPPEYLIPPSVFKSREDVGRFRDVAHQAGLDPFEMAGGLIVDDFENNGRFDIVISSYDGCAPLRYFHNNGDGTFTEQAAKAGLADQLGGLNIIQADYNNDGCLDILILRGAWQPVPQRKSLLRNNCDGTFTDVTAAAGLAVPSYDTQAAVWLDINNDGLLDLFVANENGPAQLFLNKGDGTFVDIAESAGILDPTMYPKGVAAADYDNDGYPDIYVSNFSGSNYLYHNNHDNTFTEVAQQAGVPGPGRGFATWFFDFDNDGWPDLFVTSYFASLDETVRTYLELPHNATTLKLYKNMKDGTFRDVTSEVGLDKVFMPMGANFGDIDNDGFLDIYLGTGVPSYAALAPNVLLRNHDGKYFVDVTASSGTGDWHKGHGVAFADLDNRGDEDLIAEMGGATPGDAHALRVFENPGHGNDWISLKLVGVKTNRSAIGARIKVTVENKGQGVRSIYRTVGSGGSFGASPLQQHIGLGKDARITDLEIWWPTSNTRQHFSNVGKDQFLEIKEFSQDYVKLDRRPYRLGGAKRDASVLSEQPQGNPVAASEVTKEVKKEAKK